jgi:hypothetical protein
MPDALVDSSLLRSGASQPGFVGAGIEVIEVFGGSRIDRKMLRFVGARYRLQRKHLMNDPTRLVNA